MSKREGIMLCYPFEEKRLAKWNPPYIVQPKLDGERCRAAIGTDADWCLLSSETNLIESVPHIKKALNDQGIMPYELDGELYIHGQPFEEIHSRVGRTVNMHPDYEEVGYYIFDIVSDEPQYDRLMDLTKLEVKPPLYMVPQVLCYDLDGIMRAYDMILSQSYEGIIVRHWQNMYVRRRSTYMMKFKPKKKDYYEIIGTSEEISIEGKPKGRLGSILCRGSDGNTFSVGTGLSDDERVYLWSVREEIVGKSVHVAYQHITSGKKVPRFPVYLSIEESEPGEEVGLR